MSDAKLPSRMSPAEISKFKQQWQGTFLAIHIDGGFAYGRVVRDGCLACYDLRSTTLLPVEEIERASVLFIVPMKKDYYLTAGWQILGRKPLKPPLDGPSDSSEKIRSQAKSISTSKASSFFMLERI
jgi:hypothetical protein